MPRDRVYVEFVGPWKKIEKALTRKEFEKKFAKEAYRATHINSLIIQRLIRTAIFNAGKHGRGVSGLTFAIKGSTAPLIDYGDLLGSVSFEVKSPYLAHIGVLRTAGEEMRQIAAVVHDGATINVTPQMRQMFAQIHAVSRGQATEASLRSQRAKQLWRRFKNTSPGDTFPSLGGVPKIVIPPRPFTRWALKSKEMTDKVLMNYVIAGIRAFIIPGVSKGIPKYLE